MHLSGCVELRSGARKAAISGFERAHSVEPTDPTYARSLAVALLEDGQAGRASTIFRGLARLQPSPEAYVALGHALRAAGDKTGASGAYQSALKLHTNFNSAHQGLSKLLHPGPGYVELLRAVHRHIDPGLYVEVGVETGQTLCLAGEQTAAFGIDPAPCLTHTLGHNTRVISTTSDAFFDSGQAERCLEGRRIDLAFIDGLHVFEQALRDFIHIEQYSSPDAVVMVHDCSPIDARTSMRERETTFWSGDVWKLIPCLREYRPDLNIVTMAAAPTGLAVITNLDSASTCLRDGYHALLSRYVPLGFEDIEPQRKIALNLVESDSVWLCEWLDGQRASRSVSGVVGAQTEHIESA